MADLVINGPGLPMRELRGPGELDAFQPGFGGAGAAGGFQSQLNAMLDGSTGAAPGGPSPVDAISNAFSRGVNAVNGDLEAADAAAQSFVRGDEIAVHDVMLAMTKADTSFRFMTTVGRKVVEAYQDIMRMQV